MSSGRYAVSAYTRARSAPELHNRRGSDRTHTLRVHCSKIRRGARMGAQIMVTNSLPSCTERVFRFYMHSQTYTHTHTRARAYIPSLAGEEDSARFPYAKLTVHTHARRWMAVYHAPGRRIKISEGGRALSLPLSYTMLALNHPPTGLALFCWREPVSRHTIACWTCCVRVCAWKRGEKERRENFRQRLR